MTALGLIGYVVWRFVRAFKDTEKVAYGVYRFSRAPYRHLATQ